VNDAGLHHSKRTRGTHRHINNPTSHERSAIIDPAMY
jgi:hypothetical protein